MATPTLSTRVLAELATGGKTVVELAAATGEPRGDVAAICFALYNAGTLDNEAGIFLLRGPWAVTQ